LATKKGPEALELSPWQKEPETGKINSSPSLRVLHYQVFIFGIFISCFTNKKWWPINSRLINILVGLIFMLVWLVHRTLAAGKMYYESYPLEDYNT
jgi:hypothetical protein